MSKQNISYLCQLTMNKKKLGVQEKRVSCTLFDEENNVNDEIKGNHFPMKRLPNRWCNG